ncbi:MAG: FGGY-family carbohydrate kinase [Phycisphaeraceae bacterium]
MNDHHFIGIDVGTGSARAAVFDAHGQRLGMAVNDIKTWRPQQDFVQQSTVNIWSAVCMATKKAVVEASIKPGTVRGIGIDATCSLAVVDHARNPVSIDPDADPQQDVIVWMDHRATPQADFINSTGHEVLQYVGGRVSPEMQMPKLLWLKQNMPKAWASAAYFFDLPDYLTWRCTGSTTRSLCTTVCKWTYLGHKALENGIGWQRDFLQQIGLHDLTDNNHARIGTHVEPMGQPLADGLTQQAAQDLGLEPNTAVSVSVIDAHAGGIGLLGGDTSLNQQLALIGGTSSCHMAISDQPRFVEGIWGPYYSAMIPQMWLNEGGQSATGALIDRIVFGHAASAQAQQRADQKNQSVYAFLNNRLTEIAADQPIDFLTRDLHVDPDFHGNRSPHADPTLRGIITGLRLEQDIDQLATLYLATLQAVALGTRHIIDRLNQAGYAINTLRVCGGGTKNPVFLQQHANATGCRLELPAEPEAVLLGSAILGSVAAGTYPSVHEAMNKMTQPGTTINPNLETQAFYQAKYQVFHKLHELQHAVRQIMNPTL